jgi:hypothetical protein
MEFKSPSVINVGLPRFSRVVNSKRQSRKASKFGEISSAEEKAKAKNKNTTDNFIVSNESENISRDLIKSLIRFGGYLWNRVDN